MQVTVENAGPSTAKVSFTVPADEFRKEFHNGLRQMGQRVRMKGFRPGKIPVQMLEKQFGEQVRKDVMEYFLRRAYSEAVQEQELKPLSHPRVTPDDLVEGEDGSFGLDFEVTLKPEIPVAEVRGLKIESELEPVMPDQVEAVLEDLKRQESVPEPAGEEGIDENGVVLCDVSFLHEDESVFEREGLRLSPATPPPGLDPDAFRNGLIGATDGAVIDLEMELPPTIEKEEARGQQGICRITVKEAFKMVPPSDEALFAKLEVEDEEAMRAKLKERLAAAAEQRETVRVETALLDQVMEASKFDLPDSLLNEQTEQRLLQFRQQLEERGAPAEELDKLVEEQRSTAREEAERGLRALLVVEAIGEREKLLVTDDELEAELASIAERNSATVEEVREYYAQNNLGQQMAIEVLERKVRAFLRENAEITQPN